MAKNPQIINDEQISVENQSIIMYPMSSEKCMRLIESENKITFVVDRRAKKKDIKSALEALYGLKVEKINVMIGRDGKKKAFVKLTSESSAVDIATELGIM